MPKPYLRPSAGAGKIVSNLTVLLTGLCEPGTDKQMLMTRGKYSTFAWNTGQYDRSSWQVPILKWPWNILEIIGITTGFLRRRKGRNSDIDFYWRWTKTNEHRRKQTITIENNIGIPKRNVEIGHVPSMIDSIPGLEENYLMIWTCLDPYGHTCFQVQAKRNF